MQIMKNNEKRKVLKNTENTGISDKYWYALLKNTKKSQKTQQQKRQKIETTEKYWSTVKYGA